MSRSPPPWYKRVVSARLASASLWLVPDGTARDRLAACIARLARRLGTVAFEPHVTLLSRLHGEEADLVEVTRRLAGGLPPVAVRLGPVEGREEHYRCLFARAVDTDALVAAHATAAAAFGLAPDPSFLPHLSLVYGTLPIAAKRSLAIEVGEDVALEFESRQLGVWATTGPEAGWRELAAFRLDRPRRVAAPR